MRARDAPAQLGHYPQLEDPSAVAEILRRF
jgi:hypothetical protein